MRTEMSGGRGGGSAAAAAAAAAAATPTPAAIPPSHRKVVQSLKEVVGHGDEEIYAMLKECNMDPNETAQRLMSQDTFHEVKRRRDKKKESPSNKESFEARPRGGGSYRGGRGGGAGRGGSASRYDHNGRGKPLPSKENGNHLPSSVSSVSDHGSKPPPPQLSTQSGSSLSTGASAAPALPNGSIHYPTIAPVAQGSWGKIPGRATMADMLKSSTNNTSSQHAAAAAANVLTGQQFPSSAMYSSSDPVHHPFSDQRAAGSGSAIKREIGIVGNQRPIGDRSVGGLVSPSAQDDSRPVSPPQEMTKSQELAASSSQTPSRSAAVGNGRPYQQQQQAPVNKPAGLNLEWKPKPVPQDGATASGLNAVETEFPGTSVIPESEVLSVSTKFQNLSARDDQQQVVMPSNFQNQSDLIFGSFGEGFGTSLPSGFGSEDGLDVSGSSETSVPAKDILHEQSSSGGDIVAQEDSVHHQDDHSQRDNMASNTAASISATYTSQPDISKLRSAQQAAMQYSYLQQQGYSSGIGIVPSSQHAFDSQECHLQDLPSAPTTTLKQQQQQQQQHYGDSGASFYSPSFRPGSDGDARYAQYLPANSAAGKYANGSVALPGQQQLPAAHEVTSSTSLSSSSAASQTGNTHSMPTPPQQPVPVHAYPAQPTGVPVGHFGGSVFGYQYPGYTFMPYQHSYTTSYPQPPVSSYSPSANYNPAAVKYSVPQYKPGSGTVNAPLSAVNGGYGGGYGTASSMYAANPAATATNTPGAYEDGSAAQYKESNLYMHGPQGDQTRLWQLSSDVAAAQTSSFYALSGQNQHTSYAQQSSHTHPMAGYTSLYHHPSQQQPGPAGSGHQMMQQPQTLSGAAGSTQVGATYQQLQRMQQQQPNWNAY